MTKQDEAPSGWTVCAIGDVVAYDGVFVDGDWVESKDQDPNGDVRLIQLADIGDGSFRNKSARFLTKSKAYELNCTFLKEGDLLIARMPDPLGRCCIFPLAGNMENITVVDVCVVRLGSSPIDRKYIMYLINSPLIRTEIAALQSGSTRKRISRKNLATIALSLAPLNEQHRIVAKIEALFSELNKGVESLKTAREQLKVYRQAVLKHAFEGKLTTQWREENAGKLETPKQLLARIQKEREARYQQQLNDWKAAVKEWEVKGKQVKKPAKPRKPVSINSDGISFPDLPKEWVWEYLGNLNTDVFDGPFGSNLKTSDYVEDGVRVIRLENIGYLKFIENKKSYVTVEKYESIKKHTVYPGDIIFSSFVSDGIRVAMLPENMEIAVNKADCFCLRLYGKSVRNDFAANFLSTRIAYKRIESEIHGVGRPRINTTQLKGFALPICSREEQNEIMAGLSEKMSLVDNANALIDTEIRRSEALRQSILKKAFSGQLVPQDPSDEPASVLLDRIKSEKAQHKPKPRKKQVKRKATTV